TLIPARAPARTTWRVTAPCAAVAAHTAVRADIRPNATRATYQKPKCALIVATVEAITVVRPNLRDAGQCASSNRPLQTLRPLPTKARSWAEKMPQMSNASMVLPERFRALVQHFAEPSSGVGSPFLLC